MTYDEKVWTPSIPNTESPVGDLKGKVQLVPNRLAQGGPGRQAPPDAGPLHRTQLDCCWTLGGKRQSRESAAHGRVDRKRAGHNLSAGKTLAPSRRS